MELGEKLNKLNFSEKEKNKIGKFMATLYLVDDDLEEKIKYLAELGVTIAHARELKVLCVSSEKLAEAFRIIGEVEETEMFIEDPIRLCMNPIDIYRKIKYCKGNNITYRNEDGSYMEFLFSEKAWNKKLENREDKQVDPININDFVTVEPVIEDTMLTYPETPVLEEPPKDDIISFADFSNKQGSIEPVSMYDEPVINSVAQDTEKMESDLASKSAQIAEARKALEAQLSALDDLKNNGELMSFEDIEPDIYPTMGGR